MMTIASIFLPFHVLPFTVGRYRLHVIAAEGRGILGGWTVAWTVLGVVCVSLDGTFAGLC